MRRVHKCTMKKFQGSFFQKEVNRQKQKKSDTRKGQSPLRTPPPPAFPESQPCWKQVTVWVKCGADGQGCEC
eukprot:4740247-Amphidinium_carterae.1